MHDLLVIMFDNEFEAEERLLAATRLGSPAVDIAETAVSVKSLRGRLTVRQTTDVMPSPGATYDGWWGLFISLLVGGPAGHEVFGPVFTDLYGGLAGLGIEESFATELSSTFEPGHSALFLRVERHASVPVVEEFRALGGRVLRTRFPATAHDALLAALSGARSDAHLDPQSGAIGQEAIRPGLPSKRWDDQLLARLIASDQQGAWAVIESALASGLDPVDTSSVAIVPALRQLGDRWEAGEVTVAEEHAATSICQRIVGRLSPRLTRDASSRGTIVVGGPVNELHGLPTAIAADTFQAAGYDVIDCGPNVPSDSFVELSTTTPQLVATGVSATTPGNEAAIAETIAVLRRGTDVPIILGGRAVDSLDTAQELGADLWAQTASDGVARLNEALGQPGGLRSAR